MLGRYPAHMSGSDPAGVIAAIRIGIQADHFALRQPRARVKSQSGMLSNCLSDVRGGGRERERVLKWSSVCGPLQGHAEGTGPCIHESPGWTFHNKLSCATSALFPASHALQASNLACRHVLIALQWSTRGLAPSHSIDLCRTKSSHQEMPLRLQAKDSMPSLHIV